MPDDIDRHADDAFEAKLRDMDQDWLVRQPASAAYRINLYCTTWCPKQRDTRAECQKLDCPLHPGR